MIGPLGFMATVEALRAAQVAGVDEPAQVRDAVPAPDGGMRIESRAASVIEDGQYVERARWFWTYPCHLRTSAPWLDRPTAANAWAEHGLVFGGAR